MLKSTGMRWLIIGAVLLFSAYKLWPSVTYYTMSESEKTQMETDAPADLQDLYHNVINLGLDLQGGMHVVLEVDIPILAQNMANEKDQHLLDVIEKSKNAAIAKNTDFFTEFEILVNSANIRLVKYYSDLDGLSGKDNADVITALKQQAEDAIDSALEIIRNRVDEFGVSEPTIQKSGKSRIIVELAGIKDADRARKLLQRTALLEFILVKNTDDFQQVLNKLDETLKESPIVDADTSMVDEVLAEVDTTASTDTTRAGEEVDELFPTTADESENDLYTTSAKVLKNKPFSGYLKSFRGGYGVFAADIDNFQKLLDNDEVKKLIPRDGAFVWGNKLIQVTGDDGNVLAYKRIYYMNSEAVLTGGVVTDARANLGGVGSNVSGQAIVNLTMNAEGAKTWARFTGANVGRNVAIVLDRKVYMAPVIRDRIPGGRTQISGLDDIEESKDIANVLRAGKLPAPVNVVEERTVGPSLGHDSILAGSNAMLWGFFAVILFMALYYKGSGALADLSLLLNVFLVLGALSMLKATLTLPGIAGLILTIGMAVDANVIIFERIREELDKGKTVKAAIDAGYSRAFVTILDANITTLIAAFVLAWIGSGPIKGFAVTLSIGILASMFTAVFITRTIYMMFGKKKPIKVLSI